MAARRDFGGVDQIKERCRDQRGGPTLEAIWLESPICAANLSPEPRFRRDGCRLPGGRDCRRDRAVQHRACGIAGSLPVHRQRAARQAWHARQGQAARSGGHGASACGSATERRPGRRLRLDRLGHDAERRGPPRIGAHAVPFSKRSERARGTAPPRARLQRGGRAGGRAAPAGRGAHVSVLAATLRRAARGRGADPPFEPRALHRDWRVATSGLPDGAGDCRSPACDVRSETSYGASRSVWSGTSPPASPSSDFSRSSTSSPGRLRNAFRETRVRSYEVGPGHSGPPATCRRCC